MMSAKDTPIAKALAKAGKELQSELEKLTAEEASNIAEVTQTVATSTAAVVPDKSTRTMVMDEEAEYEAAMAAYQSRNPGRGSNSTMALPAREWAEVLQRQLSPEG